MANYPTSLDTITNPTSGNTLDNPSHSLQHSDANDILEALETKLGIGASPAGSATSGHALVASTGGTTSWTTIGTAGISSGAATNGQVLTANGSSGVSFTTLPTSGLVLLNTTSFSGVSSVSLPTNTFTSTYQHYFIQAVFYCDSTVNIRMRLAGTDNTTASSYQTESHYGDANSSLALYSTDTYGYGPVSRSGEKTSMQMFVYEPAVATKTYMQYQSVRPPTNMQSYNTGIIHTQTVAYDSMSFISGSGNFATGSKISVYGVNQ